MQNYSILRNLVNVSGWRTNLKIVVIESDDWGSIRMPSLAAFERLEKAGVNLRTVDAERYNLNDTLATPRDLVGLFEVLSKFKDRYGNFAAFTPISIVANPDFDKILESNFTDYFYEPFTETLKRYKGCEASFSMWIEGINNKLFFPQIHGREHLNIAAWMKDLKEGDRHAHLAFMERLTGIVPAKYPLIDYQAAFLFNKPEELNYHEKIIEDALDLFEKIFGYRSEYFVPPNGPFNNKLNSSLANGGIKYRCASRIQLEPLGGNRIKRSFHWLGQKHSTGIRYILRNCIFEPCQIGKDWVDSCLNNIKIAFRWQKPAVISTHRVNYIGALNPSNRDKGLSNLSTLLTEIIKKWPDIRFLTTPQLGALMNKQE